MQTFRFSLLALSAAILTASISGCGGGGTSDGPRNTNPPPGGSEITEQEFAAITSQPGVWRNTTRVDFVTEGTFPDETGIYPYTLTADLQYSDAMWLGPNNSADICDANGPEYLGDDFYEDDDEYNSEDEFLDSFMNCDDEYARYFQTGNNAVQIHTYCNNQLMSNTTLVKVPDADVLDFGSLSFTSSAFPNLATNNNVCGKLAYNASKMEFSNDLPESLDTPNTISDARMAGITLRAPYNDNYLYVAFYFWHVGSPEQLLPGSYTFVNSTGEFGDFGADLRSAEFGLNTNGAPGYLSIDSGSVSISFASATAVQGSYSLTTDDGDNIAGDFSLDLENY